MVPSGAVGRPKRCAHLRADRIFAHAVGRVWAETDGLKFDVTDLV
jgi:hypothetical protein